MKAKTLILELRKEFFTLINESHQTIPKSISHWNHHDAGRCFDEAVKSLVAKIKRGELKDDDSFEAKALKSFQALVNSEEHKRIMDKYYGELVQVKASGHCSKCEPAPGKMIPVTPVLSDGTMRCMGCGRVLSSEPSDHLTDAFKEV